MPKCESFCHVPNFDFFLFEAKKKNIWYNLDRKNIGKRWDVVILMDKFEQDAHICYPLELWIYRIKSPLLRKTSPPTTIGAIILIDTQISGMSASDLIYKSEFHENGKAPTKFTACKVEPI